MICRAYEEPVEQPLKPRCPFYGFSFVDGLFIDSQGNQCGLLTDTVYPCQMETMSLKVYWAECPLNTPESSQLIKLLSDSTSFFPKEHCPDGEEPWEGISFNDWYNHIINDEDL